MWLTSAVAAGDPAAAAAEEATAAAAEHAQGSQPGLAQPGSTSTSPRQAAKAGTAGPAEDVDLKLSKEASKPSKEASKPSKEASKPKGKGKALAWPLKRKPRGRSPTCEYWQLPTCVKVREGSRTS